MDRLRLQTCVLSFPSSKKKNTHNTNKTVTINSEFLVLSVLSHSMVNIIFKNGGYGNTRECYQILVNANAILEAKDTALKTHVAYGTNMKGSSKSCWVYHL